jgi:hypothetical protein
LQFCKKILEAVNATAIATAENSAVLLSNTAQKVVKGRFSVQNAVSTHCNSALQGERIAISQFCKKILKALNATAIATAGNFVVRLSNTAQKIRQKPFFRRQSAKTLDFLYATLVSTHRISRLDGDRI